MSEQAQIEDTVGQAPAIDEKADVQVTAASQADARLE
jgi:hypothetical protein